MCVCNYNEQIQGDMFTTGWPESVQIPRKENTALPRSNICEHKCKNKVVIQVFISGLVVSL